MKEKTGISRYLYAILFLLLAAAVVTATGSCGGGGGNGGGSPIPSTAINEMVVVNSGSGSITTYSRTANGNMAPIRSISGAATGIIYVLSIFVDAENSEIVAANYSGNSILVFNRTADGNAAPIRTISGAGTGLSSPSGIAALP